MTIGLGDLAAMLVLAGFSVLAWRRKQTGPTPPWLCARNE